jgi:tetratricopeptide (TPR) repeat protein
MAKEINDEPIVDVEQAFSKTELYIEQNKKSLGIILGAIVVLVGGYFAYKYWYVAGEETKARAEMFVAEDYFGKDSIDYAMNGDKNGSVGFIQIVEDYGITPSGNLAEYYLGICYLKKGQFEEAISHLESFNGKDQIVAPLATAAIGDAHMELGKVDDAITFYLKAAEQNNNLFDSPICLKKAGLAYEEKQNYADAIKIYERIRNEYAETTEGREMDKFIARAKVLGNL